MNARTIVAGALFVVLTLTGVWFGSSWYEKRRSEQASENAARALDQTTRRTPIIDSAPAPLPTALPLLGPGGVDEDGYPKKWVDQAALRSLLWHKQYAVLTQYLTELVDAFEKDDKFERWPQEGFEAFASGEPELGLDIDAWVASDKDSFAPRLARAEHGVAVGYARRGTAFAKDTGDDALAGMHDAFARAHIDIAAALAIRPKLIPAYRLRIDIASSESDHGERDRARDEALAACPRCTEIRWLYLISTTPRWGGSYAAMDAFAKDSQQAASSTRMKSLLGVADEDRADLARKEDPEAAEALIDKAIAKGDRAPFFETRARIRIRRGDRVGALADTARAAELRPGNARVTLSRAELYFRLRRYEDAGKALLEGARIDATDAIARAYVDPICQGLVADAFRADVAGRHDDALRLYDLAAEIAPRSHDTIARRALAILGKDPPDEATLRREIEAKPDDFRLRQRFDYVLAKNRDYAKILASWDAYLAKHPDDRKAYVERAGTNANMHRLAEAKGDALKACDLGSNEGCSLARQLGAR